MKAVELLPRGNTATGVAPGPPSGGQQQQQQQQQQRRRRRALQQGGQQEAALLEDRVQELLREAESRFRAILQGAWQGQRGSNTKAADCMSMHSFLTARNLRTGRAGASWPHAIPFTVMRRAVPCSPSLPSPQPSPAGASWPQVGPS